MVLSQRERYLAIGVGAVVALFLVDHFAIEPYRDARRRIVRDQDAVVREIDDARTLFDRQRRLRPVWAEIQQGGLMTDASLTDALTQHAVLDLAQWAGMNVEFLKPTPRQPTGKFLVLKYELSGSGSMYTLSKFLWAVETATIPIHIDESQIVPHKEGADDLSLRLVVSALCMPPVDDKSDRAQANAADYREGRP